MTVSNNTVNGFRKKKQYLFAGPSSSQKSNPHFGHAAWHSFHYNFNHNFLTYLFTKSINLCDYSFSYNFHVHKLNLKSMPKFQTFDRILVQKVFVTGVYVYTETFSWTVYRNSPALFHSHQQLCNLTLERVTSDLCVPSNNHNVTVMASGAGLGPTRYCSAWTVPGGRRTGSSCYP